MDIKTETVEVQVAMNGVDFGSEETVSMVFIGKGEGTSPLIVLMAVVLFALLLAAIVLLVFGLQTFLAAKESKDELAQEEQDKKEAEQV